jgi:hypothetical protein
LVVAGSEDSAAVVDSAVVARAVVGKGRSFAELALRSESDEWARDDKQWQN